MISRLIRTRAAQSGLVCLALAVTFNVVIGQSQVVIGQSQSAPTFPLHSRRAWHRVALFGSNLGEWPTGLPENDSLVRILLIANGEALETIRSRVAAHQGTTEFLDPSSGYARVIVPSQDVSSLTGHQGIVSWQLAGSANSRAGHSWERVHTVFPNQQSEKRRAVEAEDARIQKDRKEQAAQKLRVREVIRRDQTGRYPFQPDARMGVDRLASQHPTFDGRGATIALVESNVTAVPVWHPLLRDALTLEGKKVRKVAALDDAIDFASENRSSRVALVPLSSPVLCRSTICVVAGERYVLPESGRYQVGISPGNGSRRAIAMLRDDRGALRFDTDGDHDFTDEAVVRDFNTCEDNDCGRVTLPAGEDLLITEDVSHRGVIVHQMGSTHAVMVATVSAGNPGDDAYGGGVAPGARIVLVNMEPDNFHSTIEALIRAAQMKAVDVISVSAHYWPEGATTDGFGAVVVDRIVRTYGKPIVFSAGNDGGGVATEVNSSPPSALAVANLSLGDVVRAIHGVEPTMAEWVPPWVSSRGPTRDGALRPDFVVPNERVAGRLCRGDDAVQLLAHTKLPECYGLSAGTSAAAPTVAGLLARLVSGLKQEGRPIDPHRLLWAMRASSTHVAGVPIIAQGLGVPQLDAAWRLYTSRVSLPRIVVDAPVRHVMDGYVKDRDRAPGLFEREGWTIGRRDERTLTLQRVEGGPERSTYQVSTRGDVDTFHVPNSVVLPMGERVPLRISIRPRRAGLHSAVIEIREPETGVAVAYVPLTIVVGEDFTNQPTTLAGELGPFTGDFLFSRVPSGTPLIRVDLEVLEGAVSVEADLPAGRNFSAPDDLMPYLWTYHKKPGKYTLLVPEPEEGTWAWTVRAAYFDPLPRSRYKLSVSRAHATLDSRQLPHGRGLEVRMNAASQNIARPELQVELGSMVERTWPFHAGALPTVVPITVPTGTKTMIVQTEAASAGKSVAITLYDCTTGHCALFDDRFPARATHQIRLRQPTAGLWKAIVAPGPAETSDGVFKLKTILTHAQAEVRDNESRTASWIVRPLPPERLSAARLEGMPIAFLGLTDRAAVDAERLHPMGRLDLLTNRPAFVATGIVPWPGDHSAPQTATNPFTSDK